ncbi:PREDICTED: uncharacterized protein C6C3.02c-like, partial [Camelina sativa]|uniref:Uncharacterized protein C6C3.02c-like n=1 Tax=Camelina sativa TaxID=90675 RepID=A0ABM1QUJ5_CAMSA
YSSVNHHQHLRFKNASRRSGGYRPPRSTSVRSPPPQTVKSAPPPATAQPNGGVGIFGSLGSTIADGVAWGTGNAFGHRIAESVFGPRTIKVETVASQAAPPASPVANSMSACDIQSKAFQDCVNNFGSDISKCQYYMDVLSECKKKSGSMIAA